MEPPTVILKDYTGVQHELAVRRDGVEVEDVRTGLPALIQSTSPPGVHQEPRTLLASTGEAETLTVIPLAQEPIYGVAKRPPERF